MTKTKTQGGADVQDVTKKQRKKQAKQEARLLLQLEYARRGVQKAEQKVAKACSKLEANEKFFQAVEQQLAQLRGTQLQETQPAAVGTNGTQQESEVDSGDRYDIAASPGQEVSIPPAEGRDDISTPANMQEALITDEQPASEVETAEGGVPVQTDGESGESSVTGEESASQIPTIVSEETVVSPEAEQETVTPIVEEIVSTPVENDINSPDEKTASTEAERTTDDSSTS
jgi:hypothetical protein